MESKLKNRRTFVTKDQYDQLIDGLRTCGIENMKEAAKCANISIETAKRLYFLGGGKRHPDWEPIHALFTREKVKARALVLRQQEADKVTKEKEKAQAEEHAAKVRAEEGQMTALARTAALGGLVVSSELAHSAKELVKLARKQLSHEAKRALDDPEVLTPNQIIGLLERIATLQGKITASAKTSMEMERLYLGEPQQIVSLVPQIADMRKEEITIRMESAIDALTRAREAGSLFAAPSHEIIDAIGEDVEDV
jgi:hypothetical protein